MSQMGCLFLNMISNSKKNMSYRKCKELLVELTVLSMPAKKQRLYFQKNREFMYAKIEWKKIYVPNPIMYQRNQELQKICISKAWMHVNQGITIDNDK